MTTINLNDLEEIMKSLEGGNHTLTRDDVILIAKVAATINHQSCPFGFEREEVGAVKTMLRRGKGLIYIIGLTVLTTAIGGFLSLAWKIAAWLSRLGAVDAVNTLGGKH